MALYQDYETKILTENGIDIRDEVIKRDIERYDPERALQLPPEPLERILKFLEDYNYLTGSHFELRYYQVLALLFTEQFFIDRQDSEVDAEARRMLAYWMATGSGKTLIMHLNILQYLHHFFGTESTCLQIYLTTPLANLIKQHERELVPYIRQLNEVYNRRIELVIETTQGLLQKALDYFELPNDGKTRRLILADEAHIGLTRQESGKFRDLRNRLNVGDSFLFEYSATFHNVAKELRDEYDKAIIYRYDYARFYNDGYGKDHFFKPIAADTVATESAKQLRDNLNVSFWVMEEKLQTFKRVRDAEVYDLDLTVHRPLMAFMGHTVENPKDEGEADEVSDIQKVLDYLAALSPEEREKFSSVFHGDIIGPLVVACNPDNNSELLLSYGEGEKWGMINVGEGIRFYNSIENPRIETRMETIANPNLHFENLDTETSPINVLIGSRKFAEGWNSYRLSVIALINLGSAKGNLIIQIFGRGVRLRGKGGDGKRRYLQQMLNYPPSSYKDKESDIRRLETLTVFSLRRSYLERFLKEVHDGGIPLYHTFKIQVNPTLFKVDTDTDLRFEEYREQLPIFKQAGSDTSTIKRVTLSDGDIRYTYFDGTTQKCDVISNWREQTLDYRTDRTRDAPNVYEDLQRYNKVYFHYLNRARLATVIRREAERNGIQLYGHENSEPTITDILKLVSDIRYRQYDTDAIAWTDRLNRRVVIDVIQKLRNRINTHINRANYDYRRVEREDFIYEYTVTREFETREAYEQCLQQIDGATQTGKNPETRIRSLLELLSDPKHRQHRHIYKPLLLDPREQNTPDLKNVKISPDRLNAGERKFVENLTDYIKQAYRDNDRYQFYLLRNVQKIGIYLESDDGSYFPDFVLWVVDTKIERTHILFIDPKGQRGIIDDATLNYREHPKIRLARKSKDCTLNMLEERLKAAFDGTFCLSAFILLRDSSKMGYNKPSPWIYENMLAYNILRLNWHEKTESGATSQLFNGKSYLDLMFEKAGIEP